MTFTPPMRRVDTMLFGKPSHHYEDANGQRIPGVTTIIGDGVPKPALVGWAGNTTAEYAVNNWEALSAKGAADRLKELKGARYAEKDAAARRGTEVHAYAEKLLHGEAVTPPAELAGHVDSYVRFLDEWEPIVVMSETAVVNYTVGYAGTLDLIVDMDGSRWLLDVKTTRSGVYGETALQLAAYRYAESYMADPAIWPGVHLDMPKVDHCGVVWVTAHGYSLVPVIADEAMFTEFGYAKRVARFVNEISKRVVLPAIDPSGVMP